MWLEPILHTKRLPNLQIEMKDPAGGHYRQTALKGDYTAISESAMVLQMVFGLKFGTVETSFSL